MPIANFELVGGWNRNRGLYGYNKQDIRILESEKAVNKIKRLWSKTEHDFDFTFLRNDKAYHYIQRGSVTPDWLEQYADYKNYEPKEDRINVVFTNNIGQEKVPMTAWMIAHRFAHVMRSNQLFQNLVYYKITNLMNSIAEKYNIHVGMFGVNPLCKVLGTMRSARMDNLVNRFEFEHEIVAQYIITGKITVNELTRNIAIDKKMAWGRPNPTRKFLDRSEDIDELNTEIRNQFDQIEMNIDDCLYSCMNKVYVM